MKDLMLLLFLDYVYVFSFTDSQIQMATDSENMSSSSMHALDMPLLTHPSSASKQTLRHFNSTPEVRRSTVKAPLSQLHIR